MTPDTRHCSLPPEQQALCAAGSTAHQGNCPLVQNTSTFASPALTGTHWVHPWSSQCMCFGCAVGPTSRSTARTVLCSRRRKAPSPPPRAATCRPRHCQPCHPCVWHPVLLFPAHSSLPTTPPLRCLCPADVCHGMFASPHHHVCSCAMHCLATYSPACRICLPATLTCPGCHIIACTGVVHWSAHQGCCSQQCLQTTGVHTRAAAASNALQTTGVHTRAAAASNALQISGPD
jgi:hypothetical protein